MFGDNGPAAAALALAGCGAGLPASPSEDSLKPIESPRDPGLELVRRVAAGDAAALRELYAVYGGRMHALALRMTGRASAAEDVVQESLLAAWRGAGRFRGESRVLTWLLGIVHHKAADAAAERRLAPLPGGPESDPASPSPRPEERLLDRERAAILGRGLADLPPAQRIALDLVFLQGLSLRETAEVCGCPVGTVKSRLNGAKASLRRILEGQGLGAKELA